VDIASCSGACPLNWVRKEFAMLFLKGIFSFMVIKSQFNKIFEIQKYFEDRKSKSQPVNAKKNRLAAV
jgi:hypothetical protein